MSTTEKTDKDSLIRGIMALAGKKIMIKYVLSIIDVIREDNGVTMRKKRYGVV